MERSFTDTGGQRWDVTLGRESYGVQVLLFVAGETVRKAPLQADTRIDAQAELAAMSEEQLRERLTDSTDWAASPFA